MNASAFSITRRLTLILTMALVGLFFGVGTLSAQEGGADAKAAEKEETSHTLRIASLAPKGSSWMKSFEAAKRTIAKESGGKIKLKFYAGGVMGDESAMVRKMRTGQLDGAAVTSVGLGHIDEKLLVLQLPLTFKNYKELDYVRDKMSGTFQGILGAKGFRLLTWGDVGFNYLFTQTPVKKPSDLRQTKPWVWDTDPVTKEVMKAAKINAVALGVPDVLSSLQTGVINTFLNSPYGAVALQWYTQAKFVTNLRLAVVIGGVIISEKSLEKLSENQRKIVLDAFEKEGKVLLSQIRKDNAQAIKTIGKSGIKTVEPTDMKAWTAMAEEARKRLTGKLFPKELVDEMYGHLKDVR
ncbi:TRAP transporter substrate-binding protein DctP [Bradymonas sediminis]|uniref:Uncharacterized protein n=1 Tax=Bradymonas sediminis TaxID=1548548 RepID=A0A2Z4FLH1_9DELT|nr:TRAP transporter substrate-binding protein DctP [Bradymonas sediminis]AWV89670.1 hypothetical protein DN745_10095 [Bradymonas sediminis]TDP76589.1 TRAP-type C4-dicarboxylate transport system substrate-binding protein [Bradymonas sediminis]